jgi:small GTP-binding protein
MKQIAVLGMPNTGKSTFFNRLTGAHASIANWPGTTVDLMTAKVKLGALESEVIDLPGIYDLRGFSEDEAVVRRFLEQTPVHLVVVILNAAQLDRQISLAIQVCHLMLPTVLLLNMADEALKYGVVLDADQLSKRLGIPVVAMSAKYGDGYTLALETIALSLSHQTEPISIRSIETQLISDSQLCEQMSDILQGAVQIPDQIQENLTTRLELPSYRFPTFKQMWLRSWREVKHFWIWSRKFIIFGVVAIWLLNNLPLGAQTASAQTFSGMIGNAMHPLLAPIGINPQLTVALIFGFIAKEIVLGGLSVIYSKPEGVELAGAIANQIDWVQAYSFMLFTLLYVPCLSTIAVIKSESKSIKFALLSVFWSIGLAWVASCIFYQGARALGF